MRSCVIGLALVLAFSGSAFAQQTAAVGVKGGVNFANLNFDADEADISFDRRTGFVGGLFVVFPAEGRGALQIEALYSQKGAKLEEGGGTGTIELDFLEVPVLARISSDRSTGTSFHVFGGPSLGFRLRARAKSSFEGESEDEDISDDVERLDFGVVVGAGLEFGRLSIDGRHTWGLTNLNKDDSEDVKIKSRVFSIMAGIRF